MLRPEQVCKVYKISKHSARVLMVFRQAALAPTTMVRFKALQAVVLAGLPRLAPSGG